MSEFESNSIENIPTDSDQTLLNEQVKLFIDYTSSFRDTPEYFRTIHEIVRDDTKEIKMGSTDEENLHKSDKYVNERLEIADQVKDRSGALQHTIVHLLKDLTTTQQVNSNAPLLVFLESISTYILQPKEEALREIQENGLTMDQAFRELGNPKNIQRKISRNEMIEQVIPRVRLIIDSYEKEIRLASINNI